MYHPWSAVEETALESSLPAAAGASLLLKFLIYRGSFGAKRAHKSRSNKARAFSTLHFPFYYINSIFPIWALKSTPFVYKSAFCDRARTRSQTYYHLLLVINWLESWCAARVAIKSRLCSLIFHFPFNHDVFPQSDRFLLHFTPNINVLPDFVIHPCPVFHAFIPPARTLLARPY